MRLLKATALLSALIILGGGCTESVAEKVVDRAIEKKIETETGHDADVNINDGSISFTDDASGTSGQFGGNVKLPNDFPSDVPLPDGISLTGTASSPDGTWVTYTSNQSATDLGAWYENELAADGFVKQGSFTTGSSSTLSYMKDGVGIGVVISEGTDGEATTVMVTRSEE